MSVPLLHLASSGPQFNNDFHSWAKTISFAASFLQATFFAAQIPAHTESYSTTQKKTFLPSPIPSLGPVNFLWNAPGASLPAKPMAGTALNWSHHGALVYMAKTTTHCRRLLGYSET